MERVSLVVGVVGIVSSIIFSAVALVKSGKKDTRADTEAIVRVQVMLGHLTQKVDTVSMKLDESQRCTALIDRDLALNKQSIIALDSRMTKLEEKNG